MSNHPSLFSYGSRSRSAPLPIYKVLRLIPSDRSISLQELHERVLLHIDRQASEEGVKQAVWDLVVVVGLEAVPGWDGDYRISHTDRSRRVLNRGLSEGQDAG